MTRRKASEKAKSSPEKLSRRTSRRGRKSRTASPERDDASGKEQPEEQPEAEEHKSDDSGSEQEEEEVRKRSRARRGSRVKVSEEKTNSRPRRSSRRKSQSVDPSDKEESEREENGEHEGEKDTAVMDTIPEEKPEEVQEMVVAETAEPEPVEEPKTEEAKAEPEPEIAEETIHKEDEREVESEQKNEAEVEPDEQPVECPKVDICEQSRESGEVDSESVQEDESQQASSKTEEPPKEASPEKEASEEESSSEKENRKSESPKPVRKSRWSSSKPPACTETIIDTVETKQNDADDKNDDELEAGEIKDDDVPKRSPEKKPTEEKPLRRPLQRKRRWLSSKSDAKASVITISTDSLKNIISEPVKPVPLSDVKLESSPEPEEIVDSNEEQSSGERRRSKDKPSIKSTEKEITEEPEHKPKPVDNKLLSNRKISIVSDDGNTAIARPPSPAKHHSSNILYITNLVRPFTVLQLKSLLARTGKIVENGFWIDKIKSKCFVKYETEDEAVETRHALHGVRWPASNPKCLHVDFGTETAMEKAIISTLDDAGTTRITIDNSKDAKDFGWSRDTVRQDEVRPVREWDLGKKDTFDREDRDRGAEGDRIGRDRERGERERDRDRDRDRERDRSGRGDEGRGDRGRRRSSEREFGRSDRDRRRGSTSVSPARKFKKKENEPPIRLLDDLFRKTKSTPCIYWLPLTVEQMAAKEEQRRKDMAENQRRQEEARKQEEERRKERERRDRERRERPRSNSRDRRRRSRSRDDGRRRHR